jgi:hypothetical protein
MTKNGNDKCAREKANESGAMRIVAKLTKEGRSPQGRWNLQRSDKLE